MTIQMHIIASRAIQTRHRLMQFDHSVQSVLLEDHSFLSTMRVELILFLLLLFDLSRSSEWNCSVSKLELDEHRRSLFSSTNEHTDGQCTITVEYQHHQREEKQVCIARSLSIASLPPPSFSSNHTMQTFKLNSCQLSALGQLPFSLPSSVERLDLSSNLLSTFVLAFPLPSNLKYLILDRNPNLIDMNFGPSRVQQRLIGLSLRHNKKIRLSSFPPHLTQVDLTDCNLSQSPLSTLLISLTKLTHLSLADNQLESLPSIDERIQLEYLNLSNNRLTSLDSRWLHRSLTTLDLQFNQIQSLEFLQNHYQTLVQHAEQVALDSTLQLALHGNPLSCDCWLGSILDSTRPSIIITDLHLLRCDSRPVLDVSRDDLLCPYVRHCTADCACCDFEACDCHSVCPSECSCSHDVSWKRHIVQCSQVNLTSVHMLLPQTVTELNYQDNGIDEIKPFVFIGKTSLVKLQLSNNHLTRVSNDTFCAALNLRELDLSENPSLRINLANLHELFGCLKSLKQIIVSKEQIDEPESITRGWTILPDTTNDQIVRLARVAEPSRVQPARSSTLLTILMSATNRPIRHSHTEPVSSLPFITESDCLTCTPSTIPTVFRHAPFIQHNQTLLIIVFFLLLVVLLFLMLLIVLAICRRKLRRHLTAELQRQHAHHYYYHARLHQPMAKTADSSGNAGTNESLYEQLPSLSSDSELPFLYNEKKSAMVNGPSLALPSQPPTLRQHFCCHPTGRLLPGQLHSPQEYHYATNGTTTTTTGYSTPTSQQHQCAAIFLWANRLLSPTQNTYNHRECTLHSSPSDLQHLQQCLLTNQHDPLPPSAATDSNLIRYCNNETVFVPSTSCHCRNHVQNRDAYIYPHVHR